MNIRKNVFRKNVFWKAHSCEPQVATVIDDWAKLLDNQGHVDTFTVDFEKKKAFDNSPHELLKSKLISYVIAGKTIKWGYSFLCYRQQRVVLIKWCQIRLGQIVYLVSLRSPFLALCCSYITSDIESETRHFADDCVCYCGG